MVFRACRRMVKLCSEFPGKRLTFLSKEMSSQRDIDDNRDEKLCMSEQQLYEKAIETLNSIQTLNGSTSKLQTEQQAPLTQKEKFAEMRNLPVDHLDALAAIHVAGTKGKGSVCAFSESILRSCGYKTGFYCSPHLFEVRDRMRINGKPISKNLFTHYFWKCWETFELAQKRSYKRFLVFMAFHVFLEEKVDVAVIEVGCGGEYDATNVLRHPVVCGVTLLDKDHLHVLGGTVESIAWHKAGIFKSGVPAFTVPQDPVSMKVLAGKAKERKVPLKIVHDLFARADHDLPALGIQGKHQHQNASLAVHLCHTWIERRNQGQVILNECEDSSEKEVKMPPFADTISLPKTFMDGLSNTFWPGRSQCIEKENFTFYVDGAHTRKSVEACSEWFCEQSREEKLRSGHQTMAKVLIFNFKGDRNAESLLEPLAKCDFDYVLFCPNFLKDEAQSMTSDISNFFQDLETEKRKCYKIQEVWREVLNNHLQSDASPSIHTSPHNSRVFTCVSDAFNWLVGDPHVSIKDHKHNDCLREVITSCDHVQVFVTGSLYLVGMLLRLLEPEMLEV